jgi:hypothetical protein
VGRFSHIPAHLGLRASSLMAETPSKSSAGSVTTRQRSLSAPMSICLTVTWARR